MAYHRCYGVNTGIARIFNTYGPGMKLNDGRVIPNFISQALSGRPLTVYGEGSQSRSFCYIDDLVRGLVLLADSGEHWPVNLGNPEEFTVKQLVEKMSQVLGRPLKVEFKPLPEDDPKRRKPDISRAQRILGWQPQISLEEGLRKTINHFQKIIGRS